MRPGRNSHASPPTGSRLDLDHPAIDFRCTDRVKRAQVHRRRLHPIHEKRKIKMAYNPFKDHYLVEEYGPAYIQAALDYGYHPDEMRAALSNSVTHDCTSDFVEDAIQFYEEEGEIDSEAEDFDYDAFADDLLCNSACYQLDCGMIIEFCYPLSHPEPQSRGYAPDPLAAAD